MTRKNFAIAMVLLLPLSACGQGGDVDFAEIDADGNSVITEDEAQTDADVAANFDAADADADGNLSQQEFQMAFNVPQPEPQPGAIGGPQPQPEPGGDYGGSQP